MSKRISFKDYEIGDPIPDLEVGCIQHMDLVRYSGASGDFNPIHTDIDFAKKVGLDGTIAHGMYVKAQLGRLLTNWVHPSQILSLYTKFKGMVRPGENLKCIGKIKRKKEENGKKLLIVALRAVVGDETRTIADAMIDCD